jgi:hypothetical protein
MPDPVIPTNAAQRYTWSRVYDAWRQLKMWEVNDPRGFRVGVHFRMQHARRQCRDLNAALDLLRRKRLTTADAQPSL